MTLNKTLLALSLALAIQSAKQQEEDEADRLSLDERVTIGSNAPFNMLRLPIDYWTANGNSEEGRIVELAKITRQLNERGVPTHRSQLSESQLTILKQVAANAAAEASS